MRKSTLLYQIAKEFLVRDDSLVSLKDLSRFNFQDSLFKWKHLLQLGELNRILAERCIWYFISDLVETHFRVLLDYFAHNWAVHFREAGIRSEEAIAVLARSLCETELKRDEVWSAIYVSNAR